MKINVGIDLGTTYSAVAHFDKVKGQVRVFKNREGKECTPSVICIENGYVCIGDEAKDMQSNGNVNTAAFYKSMMGDENYSAYIDGNMYSAEDLSYLYLKELKKEIEEVNGVQIEGAVITVPAYFDEHQRNATRRAGERAGFKVLKIINEPTSAIIAYGLTGGKKKNVLVYDLGGGTFDVTIAQVDGTRVSVLTTNGNHQLGGQNWDAVLLDYVIDEFNMQYGVDIRDHEEDYKELQVKCEEAKKRLTSVSSTNISIQCEGLLGKYEVTREYFDEMTSALLGETKLLIEKSFMEIGNGFGWHSLDEVVLVGGSTRMPQVREYVIQEYGKPPVTKDVNVDTIVASGAAMQAELCVSSTISLSLGRSSQAGGGMMSLVINNSDIQDITAHSLGILAFDPDREEFENSIIIPKSSAYGKFFDKDYFTSSDRLEIYVLQGEMNDPYECKLLYQYVVEGIPKGGSKQVTLKLCYNADGVVEVKAVLEGGRELTVKKTTVKEELSSLLARLKEDALKSNMPYSKWAGVSNIPTTSRDSYGNPTGDDCDLVPDGSMKGYSILFANMCITPSCWPEKKESYLNPIKALEDKGFEVIYSDGLPSNLSTLLKKVSQVWIVSNAVQHKTITPSQVAMLKEFYEQGHGLYLWGDNDPWYGEANDLSMAIFGTTMEGNFEGDKVLGIQKGAGQPGIIENHLITTGIVSFYEGITIAHINMNSHLKPLMYSSDRQIVTAYCDEYDRRCLIDGGFTRLIHKWDSAGTDRYVVNAAVWLVNLERFGYKRKVSLS